MAGLSLSLGLGLGPMNGAFDPASLFAGGSLGAYYLPSDLATMFQTSAGQTAVTAPTNPVGLMLDKSQSLALGAELKGTGVAVVSGTGPAGSYDTVTGAGIINRTDAINQSRVQFTPLTASDYYILDIENTGVSPLSVRTNTVNNTILTLNAGVRQTVYVSVVGSEINIVPNNNGTTATFKLWTMNRIAGYHASQSNSGFRPLYQTSPIRVDFDGTDDLLNTTFPNLGTNCTIVRAVPSVGASFLTGQTIAAGVRADSTDHCGLLIINRALTAGETAQVTALFNALAALGP